MTGKDGGHAAIRGNGAFNLPETETSVATLRGEGGQREHDSLYWELHEQGVRRGLRAGDLKIVQYDMGKKTPGAFELYNLKDDISEKTDLAGKNPEKLAEMRAKMDAARVPSKLFPQPALDQR